MLTPTIATLRLFLHVLAASVWVGGQIAMVGLVGGLRREVPEAIKPAAQAFARVAWPAFAVVVVTGIWNLTSVSFSNMDAAWQGTVMVKILLAVLSGMFVAVHQVGRTKLALAVGGALGALCSLGALFLGLLLHTGR